MSVINKMLRDLDARRAEGALPDLPRQARSTAMQGTLSVGAREGLRGARLWRWLAALLLLVVASAAAWYWRGAGLPAPDAGQVTAVAAHAPVPADAASAPVLAASAPELEPVAPAPPAAARPATPTSSRASGSRRQTPATAESSGTGGTAREPVKPVATRTKKSERRSRSESSAAMPDQPVSASALAPAAPPPSPTPAAPVLRRQAALQETLAQAQSLWGAGAREAAIDLLREAVAVAERPSPAGAAAEAQTLAALVRELARMELAQGRPGPVLELLARLEPALAGQADLWAVRGNAAQRLGRHPESVQAYRTALQLRPGESRWMLGAAVSLAALGQLEAAAEQAEKARAAGPVSPEVLTYLRQAGVPLR